MRLDLLIAGLVQGGGPTVVHPVDSVSMAGGDGVVLVSFGLKSPASQYKVQLSTDNVFGTGGLVYSGIITDASVLVPVANGLTIYGRVQSQLPGYASSAWTVAAGTVATVSAARLGNITINSVIPVDGGLQVEFTNATGEDTKFSVSQDGTFGSGVTSTMIASGLSTALIPAANSEDWYLNGCAYNQLLRSGPTAYFQKTDASNPYNTYQPHAINSTKLHTPFISEAIILSTTSIQIIAASGDTRDEDYTVQIGTDSTFGTIVSTVTDDLESLILTGLTTNTPYRARIRANATGKTSSDWVVLGEYVISGTTFGTRKITALGDSNTSPSYGTPYCVQGAPLLDSAAYGGTPSITNLGADGAAIQDELIPEASGNYIGFDATKVNVASYRFATNDFAGKLETASTFLTYATDVLNKRKRQGVKGVYLMPGIPYDPPFGNGHYFIESGEYFKANWKSLFGLYGMHSDLDTEELDRYHAGIYWESPVSTPNTLHNGTAGYGLMAVYWADLLNSLGERKFVKPAQVTSIVFNSGTQNLAITLPSGYVAADCEYTLNYDGLVGFNSTWVDLASLSLHIATTQAIGSVCVRIKATRNTVPSDNLLNSVQYN